MIGKAFFWNIRSVKSQKVFDRLVDLKKRHHYQYITLMESFQDLMEIEQYKVRLGLQNAYANCSSKIWIFWDDYWNGEVIKDDVQQVPIKFVAGRIEILITAVYARCDRMERMELWDSLESLSTTNCLWLVGGDFNVITNEEEKLRGLEFDPVEAIDFNQCISN